MAFVSRGGIKLEHALKTFNVDPSGLVVLDVGSSTGDLLIVYFRKELLRSIQSIRVRRARLETASGPRVVVLERQNILHLESLPKWLI